MDLAELHLLKYKHVFKEYIDAFKTQKQAANLKPLQLEPFSGPWDPEGYAARTVTDDMITDVLLECSECTRSIESQMYIHTLTGQFEAIIGACRLTYPTISQVAIY